MRRRTVAPLTVYMTVDGEEVEVTLKSKMAVCPRCRGTGTHTNPNIDGNGITGEEMDELGEDFREDYMAGVYDVTCQECGGLNVVAVIDRKNNTRAELKAFDEQEQDRAECDAIQRDEMRREAYAAGERW